MKTESDEDQTIELSDDEDEAKIMQVKYDDVTNDEERIIELEETKSEYKNKIGKNIKKTKSIQRL